MVTIGNTTLPGVQTNIESASSTGVNVGAAAQVGIVGEADLANGTANANEVYAVSTPVKARQLFGPGSQLAENIVDAITEGAYPVYAVAPEAVAVTGEDLSGLGSTSGVLANGPVSENPADYTFTVDSTVKDVKITYDDPSTETVGADEVFINPVDHTFEVDVAPSSTGNVDYIYYDYDAATDALYAARGDTVDLVGVVNENADAVQHAHEQALVYDDRYEFTVVVAGAAARIPDTSAFTNSYDSSRIQLLYPARNNDNQSLVGAYLGLRASLGINNSPIFKRLQTHKDLFVTLSKSQQEDLVGEKVVPVADESRGARIVEDLTCVADDNGEEDAMRQVLHRLIVDYVTEVTQLVSERFIGQLHLKATRNQLQSILNREMKLLLSLNAFTGFAVVVDRVDSMTASVDVGIDTVDPLRNIVATVAAGQIEGQAA